MDLILYEPGQWPAKPIGPVTLLFSQQEDKDAVYVRHHPSIKQQVLKALIDAGSPVRRETPSFNCFELLGPQAEEILVNALRLAPGCHPEQCRAWEQLTQGTSLPGNAVLALKAYDPRLKCVHACVVFDPGPDIKPAFRRLLPQSRARLVLPSSNRPTIWRTPRFGPALKLRFSLRTASRSLTSGERRSVYDTRSDCSPDAVRRLRKTH
jgi:hypothetical protein